MKFLWVIIIIFLLMLLQKSKSEEIASTNKDYYKISKAQDGLYFIHFDSIPAKPFITKGTIVEFKDFLALIEVSVTDHKLSTDTIVDHIAEGEKTLKSIKKYFPDKPLKYVLSSHWHPHSLASVLPFISTGISIVTTAKNFVKLSEFIDTTTYLKYKNLFIFVEDNSFQIKDKMNEINAYLINNEEFTSVPTKDFIFYYLPKYECIHTSCMYQRYKKYIVKGKEFVSPRTEDISIFLTKNKLIPKYIISINPFEDEPNGLILSDTMNLILKNGILPSSIESEILDLTNGKLIENADSIFKYFIKNGIPKYLINKLVYKLLAKKELNKALELAKFQAYYYPADPNSWDTLGEVFYFLGDIVLADKYSKDVKRIDNKFVGGGEKQWKTDLENHKILWEKLKN